MIDDTTQDAPATPGTMRERARRLFLDDENVYGCAETALIVLQEHYGLPNAGDSAPAMALNGGIAYSGGTCGAITGAALAVGRLAETRISDHREAKRAARRVVADLMTEFAAAHGSTQCRDLTGFDLLEDHDRFLESGIWRTVCIDQIEYALARLAPLADPAVWESERVRLASREKGDAAAGGGTNP